MTLSEAIVSGGGHNHDATSDCFLSRKVNDAFRARDVLVSAERDVEDANIVALAILYHPTDSARDCFFRNLATVADFDQHKARVTRKTSIEAIGQASVASRHDRCLRSVPLPDLRLLILFQRRFLLADVFESDDTIVRLTQVWMRVKA